jgi:hypothetical protein
LFWLQLLQYPFLVAGSIMVSPSSSSKKSRTVRNGGNGGVGGSDSMTIGFGQETKARLFLLVACLWPLCVLALFGASSQPSDTNVANPSNIAINGQQQHHSSARLNLRSVLDRVDVMGYGPTHPRVVVVVVGEEPEYVRTSVESVFRNTDMNRIFLICAVLDGHKEDDKLVHDLLEMDKGAVPHWHGLRPDIHFPGSKAVVQKEEEDEEDPHGRKIHVMFQEERQGVAASRLLATEFATLLESKHEQAGLKSPEEDFILLFLQAGSQLTDRKWLSPVTSALIVPPPLLGMQDEQVAMKLANAVSLRLEGAGQRTAFDEKLAPTVSEATAADINLSSGQSYPTPALNGAAIALRLDTFLNLPAQDPSLMDPWPANLELALNLWLCADGIDIVQDAEVSAVEEVPTAPLDPDMAARFAAVWMDDRMQQKFLPSYSSTITRLDWETKVQRAKQSPTFPQGMAKKCRSFEWYAQKVNTDLYKVLEQVGWDDEASREDAAKAAAKAAKAARKPKEAIQKPPSSVLAVVAEEKHDEPPKVQQEADVENAIPNLAQNHKQPPKVPLRAENLDIVQKAKPIDISFLDVSGGHKDHPHMGAKDVNGEWGYVHDERALHTNPPALTWPAGQEEQACSARDNNFKMMTQRVVVDMDYDKEQEESGVKRDKIFCLVYTIESGHHKIPSIRETWG